MNAVRLALVLLRALAADRLSFRRFRKSIPRAKQHTYIKIKHEIKSNYLPSSRFLALSQQQRNNEADFAAPRAHRSLQF